ncbi:MAG: hypothetical protein ACM3ML_15615 [Micromonosporaceae bacterium]
MNSTGPAAVTVVTAPACHFCEDARVALAELAKEYPLTVTVVPGASPAGQAVTRQHRSGMFPLVLVDGVYFSAGRLPRRKLARLLATRSLAPEKVG